MEQDEEVKQLTQLRDSLRLLLQVEGKEVGSFFCLFTHLQPNCVWKMCAGFLKRLTSPAAVFSLSHSLELVRLFWKKVRSTALCFQEYLNRKNSGNGYSIHQPQGNKKYGTEKSGFLLKKSDGCVNASALSVITRLLSRSWVFFKQRSRKCSFLDCFWSKEHNTFCFWAAEKFDLDFYCL